MRTSAAAGWVLACALAACAMPAPVLAALGGPAAGVEADRSHMSARMSSARRGAHMVHTLTLPNGVLVREFSNSDGVVFAVTWRGAGRPDLSQLLGDSFSALQADNVPGGARRPRMPLAVSRPNLVVRTGGHPDAFWGAAYIPQLTPSGFTADDLQQGPGS